MDRERLRRVRAAMASQGLDALVCRLPENVLFLSGHWPLNGWSFLLLERNGAALCVVPHCDESEARRELWNAECRSFVFGVLGGGNPYEDVAAALRQAAGRKELRKVGIEGCFESVAPPWNAAEPAIPSSVTRGMLEAVFGRNALVDATGLLNELRSTKTKPEQKKWRIANEIAAMGLRAFRKAVRVGTTGVELVAAVEHAVMTCGTGYKGARRVRAFAQVSTGPAETALGYRPMEISTARRMRNGDIALLELAVVADGYWADRTRPKVAGTPSAKQRHAFDAIRRAQTAAIAAIRPGATAKDVDAAARSVIHSAGYDDRQFLHVTGHGLGLRYHEPTPLLAPGIDVVLKEGMTCTVEPGLYIRGMGGMRLEDNIIVTATGAEVVGPAPSAL